MEYEWVIKYFAMLIGGYIAVTLRGVRKEIELNNKNVSDRLDSVQRELLEHKNDNLRHRVRGD